METDIELTRALLVACARHAAEHAVVMAGEGDVTALADQFEAAGLDCLAAYGFDVRLGWGQNEAH